MKIYITLANEGIKRTSAVIQSITNNIQLKEVRDELCFYLISVVHLVGDIYDRQTHKEWETTLLKEDADFLFAFAYVNNQIKHDKALNKIYNDVCGSMFPMSFPMRFGTPGVYWRDWDDNETKKPPFRPFYDSCLKEKDVLVTLEKLAELLVRIEKIN